jgi:sugar phosphate isomerase/epimerase
MRLGYNTNGFAHHHLEDAIEIIGEIGYRAVAITLDVHHLDPYAPDLDNRARAIGSICRDLDVMPLVETGARFLLDPRRKHQPTLLSSAEADRARRIDFLFRAIDVAVALTGPPWQPIISLWSGAADVDGEEDSVLDARLADGLRTVCARAEACGAIVAFEPEPGMWIEDMQGFGRIADCVDHRALRLTLDVGHAHLTEPEGATVTIQSWASRTVNVQLEGMRRGVHDHLPPWEGDLDVIGAVQALRACGYVGPACLELSRSSHDAVRIARRAHEFLAEAAG